MVLLVVDTQKAIVNSKLYNYDLWVSNVKEMIAAARGNNIEVIFVRNDDGPGCELTKGNDGFEIYDGFKPADNEAVFDKCVNSAFRNTGLLEYVNRKMKTPLSLSDFRRNTALTPLSKPVLSMDLK